MTKEITTSIIAILVILAAVGSLFFTVNEAAVDIVRILAGAVIGFYFGQGTVPFGRVKALKAERR